MRNRLIILSMMLCFALPASAQVGVSVGIQTANIGISISTYPNLVRVPGYPVYYAADVNSNYFFYDGMFWLFEADRWYASFWYNGPWIIVDPEFIPVYLLRIPVRYYRRPPVYFVGWQADSPPRWDAHWGNDWAQRRRGWDRWNPQSAPAPAPLPTYQRNYSGERYPSADQQVILHERNYRHQPSDPLVRQQSRAASENRPDRGPRGKTEMPERRGADPQAAPPGPASSAPEPAPADRQPPRQQRPKEKPEPQAPPMTAPRGEERPVPRSSPPASREMRPQAEPEQRHMAPPPREDRPSSRPEEPGQRRGPQKQQEKSDERGPDRGR